MKNGIHPKQAAMPYLSQRPGLELLKAINEGALNPKELHRSDRLVLVETLRMEGWGQSKIAQVLHCDHSTIKRDVQLLKDRMAPLVAKFTKERVAAESIGMADGLRQRAIAANKLEVAWQITKELPALIQSLGLLEKAPTQFEGHVTLEQLVAGSMATPSEATSRN